MAGGAEAILMTAYSGHGQAREELPTLVCKHLQTHSESRLPISFHLSVKGEARERAGQPLKWPSVLIYCIWGLSGFCWESEKKNDCGSVLHQKEWCLRQLHSNKWRLISFASAWSRGPAQIPKGLDPDFPLHQTSTGSSFSWSLTCCFRKTNSSSWLWWCFLVFRHKRLILGRSHHDWRK